jgi:magnesium-transporting ATPase (P-type)
MSASPEIVPATYDGVHHRAHTLTPDELTRELKTSVEQGLTLSAHESRLAEFGPNKIPEQKSATSLELLWEQINSMIIYILIIGAAISFAFDHLIDGIVIILVVVINVGLGFYMERRAISATDSLKNMMSPVAQVIRDGEKQTVETVTLVPGDIIVIQPGDIAPADARIVKQSNLQMMEAALTGESHATMKDIPACADASVGLADRKCMIFSGTQVIKGSATCIVIATAQNCEIGKISGLLADLKPAKTPLLQQLESFGMILSMVIIGFSFGTFGIAVARGYSIGDSLSIAIGVAVAAIPEGLPSCITVTFAIGVRFMATIHAIVKSLPAVETLGSVGVICSDKTGTLTENKMSVQRVVRLSDKGTAVSELLLNCFVYRICCCVVIPCSLGSIILICECFWLIVLYLKMNPCR